MNDIKDHKQQSTGKSIYNIVADTITGINYRKKDNLFQLHTIVVSIIVSVIGAQVLVKINNGLLWFENSGDVFLPSLVFGLFAGVTLGGGAIAIYRFIRHLKGKHD
jgi:H+/Cl- antiporter ClcA